MMDIKNYYLGTPLPRFEYMKMLLSCFPKEIIQKYNLNDLAVHGTPWPSTVGFTLKSEKAQTV
jgi:hypothetical protein